MTTKGVMPPCTSPSENNTQRAQADRPKKTKLSWNEEKELASLPDTIAQREDEMTSLQQALSNPDIYRENPLKAREMQSRIEAIEADLLVLFERWETLDAKKAAQ